MSPDYQDMLNVVLIQVDESEATKLREFLAPPPQVQVVSGENDVCPFSVFAVMKIIKLQNQLRQLQRRAASDLPDHQKTGIHSFTTSRRRHRGHLLKCVLTLILQRR